MAGERLGADRTELDWLRGKRILVAEDNLTNQMVATQMLEALGAGVEIANDGAEALEMLSERFDLFLIDIEMPRISGLDVIRAIREAGSPLRDAPVVALTAYALREHREKIEQAGADGLIPKPLISIEQFGREIAACSGRRRAVGESRSETGAAGSRSNGIPAPGRAAETQGEAPVVDAATYDGLIEAIGEGAMSDLLSKLDADLARASERTALAAREEDAEGVAAATHILISVCGAVGGRRAEAAALRLNAAAQGRVVEPMRPLARTLQAEVEVLRGFVQERLRETSSP